MKKNKPGKENTMSKDDLIREIVESKKPTRYLVARMYIEFREQFIKLNGKVSFHDKFIWTLIGILVISFVGGIIAVLFQYLSK